MKTLLLTVFLNILFCSSAQDFQKRYDDNLYAMIPSAISSSEEYGILVAGELLYHQDGLIYLADTTGQVVWQYQMHWENDSLEAPYFTEVITTSDSAFIIAGYARKWATTVKDAIVLKIDINGNLLWEKRLSQGISTPDYNSVLTKLSDSTFCVAYGARTNGQGINLAQFHNDGSALNSFSLDFGAPVLASSILSLNDSTIILAGALNQSTSPIGIIAEIGLSGTTNWISRYPDASFYDVVVIEQSLYLLAEDNGNFTYMAKSDLTGTISQRTFFIAGSSDINDAKPHLYQLADTTLLAITHNSMWSSYCYHVDTTGFLFDWLEPELIYAQAIPTQNGGAAMVGHGPFLGVKNQFDEHIGIIRRDSVFTYSECLHIYSNTLSDSTGITPIPGNATIISGPQITNLNATVSPFDMEVVNGCVLFIGSVDELDQFEFLSIYPNYSDGLFNLELMKGFEVELHVYNNLGQLIQSEAGLSGTVTLDLTSFEDGSYHFKAITDSGHQQSGTLVIRH